MGQRGERYQPTAALFCVINWRAICDDKTLEKSNWSFSISSETHQDSMVQKTTHVFRDIHLKKMSCHYTDDHKEYTVWQFGVKNMMNMSKLNVYS